MNKFNIIDKLSKASYIFDEPISSGQFIWRRKGMLFVENLIETLREEMSKFRDTHIIEAGFMADVSEYNKLYRNIASYTNVFMLENKKQMLRAENTSVLLKNIKLDPSKAYLVNTPLYREFKTKAFLIDQRIWPAPGYICSYDIKDEDETIRKNIESINSFFDAFLLPRIWVAQESGFKNFAKKMYLPLMPESNENMTVASTLYVLSDTFNEECQIEQETLQYGFSERLIYIYCRMQENCKKTIWPQRLTPFQISYQESIGLKTIDKIKGYRIQVIKETAAKNIDWDSIDTPIMLFNSSDNTLQYRLNFSGRIGTINEDTNFQALLNESDTDIFKNNNLFFNTCLSKHSLLALCEACLGSMTEFTSIGIDFQGLCSSCVKCEALDSKKHFLVQSNTNKTINEKIMKQTQ